MTKQGYTVSEKVIEQREQAARKHGVYAVRDNGPDAMTEPERSRFAELQVQFEDRRGVVAAMRDQAVNSLLLSEIAQAYVISEHKAGVPLDKILLLGKLPAFWNSAGRALKNYLDTLPDDSEVLDLAEHVKRLMGEDSDNGHS